MYTLVITDDNDPNPMPFVEKTFDSFAEAMGELTTEVTRLSAELGLDGDTARLRVDTCANPNPLSEYEVVVSWYDGDVDNDHRLAVRKVD